MVREVLKDEMPRIAELNLKTRAPGELRQKTEKLAFNRFFFFFKNRETRLQCFFFLFQKQRNSPTIVFFLFGNTKSHIQLFCSVTHHLLGGGVNPPWLCAQLLPEQGIVEASSPDEPRVPHPPSPLPSTPPPPQPTVLPHPYPPQGFREQGSSLRRRPRARDPTRRGFFFLSFFWTLPTSSSPLQPHPHPHPHPPPIPYPPNPAQPNPPPLSLFQLPTPPIPTRYPPPPPTPPPPHPTPSASWRPRAPTTPSTTRSTAASGTALPQGTPPRPTRAAGCAPPPPRARASRCASRGAAPPSGSTRGAPRSRRGGGVCRSPRSTRSATALARWAFT